MYCKRCLYPLNHPLGLILDADGVCSGCRVHEEKFCLDWVARGERLGAIFDAYRDRSGNSFDCIVPISGARDSYFIVETVRKRFGMKPLLVGYNRHYNTDRGTRNLAYLRTVFDCDYMEMLVAPQTVQRISRETIRRAGSLHWHVLAGGTVWPVQVAVRLKIPLIVWGAHQGLDQVGMYSHTDEVEMTRKYRCEHDLMGIEAEDLAGGSEGLDESDLRQYVYPHDRDLSKAGVRGIYLGNFIPWDSKAQHERMIERYEYETSHQPRTFDTYNDVDCQHYNGLHDHVKFLKWGYGKVTDHACREIRWGRLVRTEGIDLVRRYQDVSPPDKQRYLAWIKMEETEFDVCIDRFRDSRIWRREEDTRWKLRDSIVHHADETGTKNVALTRAGDCEFRVTPSKSPDVDETKYALIRRGYIDGTPAVTRKGRGR